MIFPWLSLELVKFPDFPRYFLDKTHFLDFSLISLNSLIWQTPCGREQVKAAYRNKDGLPPFPCYHLNCEYLWRKIHIEKKSQN